MIPFQAGGRTLAITASTTSAPYDVPGDVPQLESTNAGATSIAISCGESPEGGSLVAVFPTGATATTVGDYVVISGQTKVISKGAARKIAVVAASGTPLVYVSPGSGI